MMSSKLVAIGIAIGILGVLILLSGLAWDLWSNP